jgi:tetratricopeptide (TPR) repeat protein
LEYARQGQIDEALAALRQAVELDPTLELDPEAEVARVLVELGRGYMYDSAYDDALDTLRQAIRLDPTLELDPEAEVAGVLVEQGRAYAYGGEYDRALDTLRQAVKLDPAIELSRTSYLAQTYNVVCWLGSLDGLAETVLPACERAVELEPDDGGYRDSRGLARALTGDYAGAIEDFQFFVEWGRGQRSKEMLDKRRDWIQRLEADRNPFDEATLEALRYE